MEAIDDLERSDIAERHDFYDLFDMDSVIEASKRSTITKKSFISRPKTTLNEQGQIYVTEESFVCYDEIEISKPPPKTVREDLAINIFRGCTSDLGAMPIMPSLRLDMLEKEYKEPTRDRNKNWRLDSQRIVINKEDEPPHIKLGKYVPAETMSPLYWSPAYQSLIRKTWLFKTALVVSETASVVEVFGVGINGRILSADTGNSGRYLIFELYSIWNCQRHEMTIPCSQLYQLFSSRPELLKIGKKANLIPELVRLLYFEYTIRTTVKKDSDDTEKEEEEEVPETMELVQTVEHLQRPDMPVGFAQTVAEIMRRTNDPPDPTPPDFVVTFPIPVLSQELRISSRQRMTASQYRRLAEKERLRLEAEAFEKKRKDWLAIPRRLRGLQAAVGRRIKGWLLILTAYNFPLRPTVVNFWGHFSVDCVKYSLMMGFGSIGSIYSVNKPTSKWTPEMAKEYSDKIIREATLKGNRRKWSSHLSVRGIAGTEGKLPNQRSCFDRVRNIYVRRKTFRGQFIDLRSGRHSDFKRNKQAYPTQTQPRLLQRNVGVEGRLLEREGSIVVEGGKVSVAKSPAAERDESDDDDDANNVVDSGLGPIGLDAYGRKSNYSKHFGYTMEKTLAPIYGIPRREIGRGVKLCGRARKIGPVYCIYSAYISSALIKGDLKDLDNPTVVEYVGSASLEPIKKPIQFFASSNQYTGSYFMTDENGGEAGGGGAGGGRREGVENGDNDDDDASQNESTTIDAGDDVYEPKNLFHESYVPDFQIDLEVYMPEESRVMGRVIPAGGTQTFVLTKEDFFRLVPDHAVLYSALRVAYEEFFWQASEDEVKTVRQLWDNILSYVLSQARWIINYPELGEPDLRTGSLYPVSSSASTTSSSLSSALLSPPSTAVRVQDKLRKAERLLTMAAISGEAIQRLLKQRHEAEEAAKALVSEDDMNFAELDALDAVDDDEQDGLDETLGRAIGSQQSKDSSSILLSKQSGSVGNIPVAASLSSAVSLGDISSDKKSSSSSASSGTSKGATTQAGDDEAAHGAAVDAMRGMRKINSRPPGPEPMLVVPTIIHKKIGKISSNSEARKFPLLQVYLWQNDTALGAVAYDIERGEVYSAVPSPAVQAVQIRSFRFLPPQEKVVTMNMFIVLMLEYFETPDENNEMKGGIRFVEGDLQVDGFNAVSDDYAERTQAATDKAQSAMNSRVTKTVEAGRKAAELAKLDTGEGFVAKGKKKAVVGEEEDLDVGDEEEGWS